MDETNQTNKTFWEVVPRKIVGGLVAMWLIAQAAIELKEAAKWQFALAILCMSGLGLLAIWTHYLLERGPVKRRTKDDGRETPALSGVEEINNYHPDLPVKTN